MDWKEIDARLKDRAEDVCRHLLPRGKRVNQEWCTGDLADGPGESLKIHLSGERAGVWAEFGGDGRGKTMISLWCAVRAKPFRECIREAKDFLGIRDDFDTRVKTYAQAVGKPATDPAPDVGHRTVAEEWKKCQPITEGGPVWQYLVEKRRLDASVVALYGVREVMTRGQWAMVFPYYLPPEEEAPLVQLAASTVPAWLKYELLDRPNGKKREWTTRGAEKSLFGLPLANEGPFASARHVLLCEGEKDAMSWATYGCNAWDVLPLSVPFGAKWKGQDKSRPSPNREWLDRCWPFLEEFESIYIAMDSDDAGRMAAADLIAEIGPRRCRLVTLPAKNTPPT